MVQYTTPLEQVTLIPGQAHSLLRIEHVFMHVWAAIPSAGTSEVGVCGCFGFAGRDPSGRDQLVSQASEV